MGRGRAKAKQTKVARQLKYSSGGTDLDRLRAELAGSDGVDTADSALPGRVGVEAADEDDDPHARYADSDDESDYDSGSAAS